MSIGLNNAKLRHKDISKPRHKDISKPRHLVDEHMFSLSTTAIANDFANGIIKEYPIILVCNVELSPTIELTLTNAAGDDFYILRVKYNKDFMNYESLYNVRNHHILRTAINAPEIRCEYAYGTFLPYSLESLHKIEKMTMPRPYIPTVKINIIN